MWVERNKVKPGNNTFIKQAWTNASKKSSSKFPSLKIISKYVKLYCEYSSLNSLKYLADSRKSWYER